MITAQRIGPDMPIGKFSAGLAFTTIEACHQCPDPHAQSSLIFIGARKIGSHQARRETVVR
jgi:hypothetical protein